MHRPYCSRVNILARDEEFYWTVDGTTAIALCRDRLAEPLLAGPFAAFVRTIRLLVEVEELREKYELRWCRRGKPKPYHGVPESSTGGGDQGLSPLIGRHIRLHYGAPQE